MEVNSQLQIFKNKNFESGKIISPSSSRRTRQRRTRVENLSIWLRKSIIFKNFQFLNEIIIWPKKLDSIHVRLANNSYGFILYNLVFSFNRIIILIKKL